MTGTTFSGRVAEGRRNTGKGTGRDGRKLLGLQDRGQRDEGKDTEEVKGMKWSTSN